MLRMRGLQMDSEGAYPVMQLAGPREPASFSRSSTDGPEAGSAALLIDLLSEAAFAPDRWRDILDGLARQTGSAAAVLLVIHEGASLAGQANRDFEGPAREILAGAPWKSSSWLQHMLGPPSGRFIDCAHLLDLGEQAGDPLLGLLRGLGITASLWAGFAAPQGERIVIMLARRRADGPYEPVLHKFLQDLYPHIARAGSALARWRMSVAESALDMLACLELPAAIMGSSGGLLLTNTLFDALPQKLRSLDREGLVHADDLRAPSVRHIPVDVGGSAFVLHVASVPRPEDDLLSREDKLVLVTAVGAHTSAPSAILLKRLFGLTAGEAAIAVALASGDSITQAAEVGGVTVKTARTYLERIFRKTRARRQGELVALLKSAGPLGSAAGGRRD